jgi:outer membrane protein TolC
MNPISIKYDLILFLSAVCFASTMAQSGATLNTDDEVLVHQLPAIQQVIDTAMKNSPLLEMNQLAYEQAVIAIREINQRWLEYLYIEGSTRYGLLNHLTINQLDTENTDSYGLLTQNEQLNYYAGISLKFPVSEFFKRRTDKKRAKLEVMENRLQNNEIRDEITKMVIEEYYMLRYYKERINSFQEVLQTIEISYLNAQKGLEKGHLKLNEFANISESRGRARDGYLKAMNEYYAQHKKLEVIIGTDLNNL